MISKRDISIGKLAVKNGLISSEELEDCLDELRQLYLEKGEGPSLSSYMVNKNLIKSKEASALKRAHERLSRDAEKEEFSVKGYELIRKIGEGGLGVVFKARQVSMNRLVAIKILHRKWLSDEEFRKRFLVEARIVGKLSHQNLIKVFDVGREDWKYYFSMEYIDGETVEDMIEEEGALDLLPSINIMIQILRALKYISTQNIVHCDIKPGNILLTKDGIAKLGDFGFVQTNIEIEPAEEGTVLGTPDYIPPEQAMGKDVDFRSDIYSLGATLYHMLTGSPPYKGTVSTVMEKHIREEVPPIQEVAPDLPKDICKIVEKMMAKSPRKRYQKFENLFEDLEEAKLGLSGSKEDFKNRSKSTLYNVIKREKNRGMKQLADNIDLEQKMKNLKLALIICLVYMALSTLLNLYFFFS